MNIRDEIKIFLSKRKPIKDLDKNIIQKDLFYNEELVFEKQISSNSLQFNSSFFGKFKFESISKRRNSYTNIFRRQRLSKSSLHSALTS